jgi:hypothetical protein
VGWLNSLEEIRFLWFALTMTTRLLLHSKRDEGAQREITF